MGSVDAEVEIDMEISDDEQESLKGCAVAGHVVHDGGVVQHNSPAGATTTDSILILLVVVSVVLFRFGKVSS